MALVDDIVTELTTELTITDPDFNAVLLKSKVDSAYEEVKEARKYPSTYTDTVIETDMARFKRNVKNIALYDYNKIGAEFEDSHNGNGTSRNYSDRSKLFGGVIPIAVL